MRVIDRSKARPPCPKCGGEAARHSVRTRTIQFLDGPAKITTPMLRCRRCDGLFMADCDDIAPFKIRYGWDVIKKAVLCVRRGATLEKVCGDMHRQYKVEVSATTLHVWVKRYRNLWRGKMAG